MNWHTIKLPGRLPNDREFTLYIPRASSPSATTPASDAVTHLESLLDFSSTSNPRRFSFCGSLYLADISGSDPVLYRILVCICHHGEYLSLTARKSES